MPTVTINTPREVTHERIADALEGIETSSANNPTSANMQSIVTALNGIASGITGGNIATNIGYNNATSGMQSTNVQNAIDELSDEKSDKSTTLSGYGITDAYTKTETDTIIGNLPKSMIFKGTLGTNGTITTLTTVSSSNEGFTYKVITAGTYDSKSAKVGDLFTSSGSEWVLIPSGDETDTDTWRGVNVNGTQLLGSGISSGNVNFKSGTNATVTGSGNDITVDVITTFTEANTRTNISSGDTLATILGKIKKFFTDLKTVAFTGSYTDLSDKPTIPSVGNGTLTIQKNGSNLQTFSANQSGDATANITVPTKTSDLTNDSGYTTNAGTITGINMNGSSKGTSGVVDLGTVITSHQDISGKADKSTTLAGYGITNAYTKDEIDNLGLSVVNGKLCMTYEQ